MARLIEKATQVEAAGTPPKTIRELVGAVNTGEARVSIALVVNTGTQLLAEEAGEGPEPDNGPAERYLRGRLETYAGAAVPPLGVQAVAS